MSLPISRRLDFKEIPVIDIGAFADSNSRSIVQELKAACCNVGFFYVSNHGIEAKVIDRVVELGKAFFAQPMAEKEKVLIDHRIRGYLPLYYRSYEGEERAGTSHQEGFWIGHEQAVDVVDPLRGPNQWPQYPEQLRRAMLTYFEQVEALSRVLAKGFANALNVDSATLISLFDLPTSRLKINHYPPQHHPTDENNIGVVPHTDSGGFTILWQDDCGGLEVQNRNGEWVEAPPMKNTLVVNIGNIMQHWSGGRFSSTPHRVINRGGRDRYSIPLFVNPNSETLIAPLVSGAGLNTAPFNYGDYQRELWRRTFPVANI